MAAVRKPRRRRGKNLIAGVDLGGTKIQTVVLDGEDVVGQSRVATPTGAPEAVINAIAEAVRAAMQRAGADRVASLGVGSPGEIDAEQGTVSQARNVQAFASATVKLGPALSKALGGLRVTLENDVRAGILGEHRLGAGRPYSNLLGVWLGTGVGGGVIIANQLLEGRGAAGEIGHAVVQDGGWLCSCGRRGCLEAYAGRGCMEARARRRVKRGKKTVLFEIMERVPSDRLTSGVFARALKRRDPMAEKLIDRAQWALSLALASAQNLLNLEAIILGGGLGDRLGPDFAKSVSKAMQPHLFVPEQAPPVLNTKLGDLAGAVGAALRGAGP
ncbi:MAG TPA: ROK family protein [Candidatus Dormibacteraeota bacterium]